MCGIVGFAGKRHRELTKHGLSLTHHRGPDELVVKSFSADQLTLGMNRLAIRDLQKHLYPFHHNHLHLVYNGELYNVSQIQALINYIPNTACDAELISPLVERYGLQAFDMLVGMFAIAIYDDDKHCLYLARDKFGEKPLYYQITDTHINFSSELRVFAAHQQPTAESLITYLAFGYQPHRHSIYEKVHKVLPGEVVTISLTDRIVKQHRYATNPVPEIKHQYDIFKTSSLDETIDSLDTLLSTIASEKKVSDVPVGAFLSGGVDSSLLTALTLKAVPASQKLKTYSIKFDHAQYDESPFSRQISKHLKTDHIEIPITAKKVASIWDSVIEKMDEPFADPAVFPTYLLAERAAQDVTVIISGEGADEFFGGYPRFKKQLWAQHTSYIPSWLSSALMRHIPSQRVSKLVSRPETIYTAAQYSTLWDAGTNFRRLYLQLVHQTWEQANNENNLSVLPIPLRLFMYDLRYYVGEQLCMKVDKMTMLHSIESRAPYLDERLFPHMAASAKLLKLGYQDKFLLRSVAERYMPKELAWRTKQGFSLPLEYWLKEGLVTKTKQLLSPHPIIDQVLPLSTVNHIARSYLRGSYKDDLAIWNLLILDGWLKIHYS